MVRKQALPDHIIVVVRQNPCLTKEYLKAPQLF